jgi:DUF971 family protein
MTNRAPIPTEIRRLGTQSVRIAWGDGHRSEYTNRFLRDHCPCAMCRKRPRRSLPLVGDRDELYAVQVGVVGRYAVSIKWSDGHDSGIYSYETLRALCPCDQCQTNPAPVEGAA